MIKTKWVLVWSFILLFKIAAASLVAHSQGVAASAGIADVLIENGYKVEASYNIAPKQPGDIKFNSKVGRVVEYIENYQGQDFNKILFVFVPNA